MLFKRRVNFPALKPRLCYPERRKCLEEAQGFVFQQKFKLTHLIIVCLVVAALTAGATYALTIGGIGSKQYFDDAKAYVEIEKIINENYIGSVDDDTLFNAAASAMVRSIDDKWSYYMSPEEYAAYKLTSSNEYAGIGISVKQNDSGDFEIFSVDSGTPAEAAGLTAGQLIVSVDGQPVADMTLSEMQELIRSKLNKDFPMVVSDKRATRSASPLRARSSTRTRSPQGCLTGISATSR